ncbi:allantoate amidohydrolase, partial [Streptomyces rhizosphaericola]
MPTGTPGNLPGTGGTSRGAAAPPDGRGQGTPRSTTQGAPAPGTPSSAPASPTAHPGTSSSAPASPGAHPGTPSGAAGPGPAAGSSRGAAVPS